MPIICRMPRRSGPLGCAWSAPAAVNVGADVPPGLARPHRRGDRMTIATGVLPRCMSPFMARKSRADIAPSESAVRGEAALRRTAAKWSQDDPIADHRDLLSASAPAKGDHAKRRGGRFWFAARLAQSRLCGVCVARKVPQCAEHFRDRERRSLRS
jgi:hypothetical protein